MNDTQTAEQPRVLPLEGIHNFRDYGGYAARGGRVRRAMLYRSGQHQNATDTDLAAVDRLDIRTVIDLRGDTERRDMPCRRGEAFCGTVLFEPGETAGQELAPHEEAGQGTGGQGIATADEARAAMMRLYAAMPFRPVLIGSLRLYFDALATREGASLLHCLAGKDRTGFAVALLHTLLGVHHDDMMADFLLTNTAGDQQARVAAAAVSIRERYGPQMTDAAIVALMSVEAPWLDTAMASLRERHGSVETYADEVLGVTPERRAMLAERLVA